MARAARARVELHGGVGTFGGNCAIVRDVDSGFALVLDAGARFCDEGDPWDLALPAFDALEALDVSMAAVVLTHGHEDHIGALPFLTKGSHLDMHATGFTARRLRRAFKKRGRAAPPVNVVQPGDRVAIGPFSVRWVGVNHSIPDATAVVVDTAGGAVLHSGDFRIEKDPVLGAPTDMGALERLGDEGVRLLLADSTGALSTAAAASEASVIDALGRVLHDAPGRVIVATYGSHVQRVAAVSRACAKAGRALFLVGDALTKSVTDARELGLLSLPVPVTPLNALAGTHPASVCLVVTGTQGEPQSALARMARGAHKRVTIAAPDRVALSARVIPGNERAVDEMLRSLRARGAEIVVDRDLHVSGHGPAPDLDALLCAARPDAFVAVHGGHEQLAAHRALAVHLGLERAVREAVEGDVVCLGEGGEVWVEPGPAPAVALVRGSRVFTADAAAQERGPPDV